MQKRESVKSVERAMKILNCFSQETPQLGITELSKKLKVSKSTIHRLVTSMQKEGFIMQDEATQQYRLGFKILHLSKFILQNMDIRTVSTPIMQKLRDKTNETVGLSIIFNDARICIEKADSFLGIRRFIEIGQQLPLYTGASGKVLLAYQGKKFIQHILYDRKLEAFTEKTVINPEQIVKDLQIIKEKGYCISSGEHIADVTSISAPIWNHNKKVIACLNISGPSFRFTAEKTEDFLKLLLETAADISRKMGYQEQLNSASDRKKPSMK